MYHAKEACGGDGQGGGKGRTRLVGDQILQTLRSMQQLLADDHVHVMVSGYVCYVHPDAPESTGAKQMAGEWSEHAKALTALADGQLQHPVHFFIRVIRREAQLVKTRVCSW